MSGPIVVSKQSAEEASNVPSTASAYAMCAAHKAEEISQVYPASRDEMTNGCCLGARDETDRSFRHAEMHCGAAYQGRVPSLRVIGLTQFVNEKLRPREHLLSPWLLSQSLNMIYAWRGVGKTHVALGIAYAVATGGNFLKRSSLMTIKAERNLLAITFNFSHRICKGGLCPTLEVW